MNGFVTFFKVVVRRRFMVFAGLVFAQCGLAANTFTVNSHDAFADETPGDCICAGPIATGGLCGVHTAIVEAEACDGTDTIEIPGEIYHSGSIRITTPIIFQGLGFGKAPTILQFTNTSTIDISFESDFFVVEFRNLTLSGGRYISNGKNTFLKLDQVTVSGFNNDSGGVIKSGGGLKVNSSTVVSNFSSGGTISALSDLTITDSEMYANNSSSGCGGAISFNSDHAGNISNTRIHDNIAQKGGAICVTAGDIKITRSSLTNNRASLDGGAIYTDNSGHAYLTNTTVSGNQADGNGGAIMVDSGYVGLASSTVTNNTANADNADGGSGGGVYKVENLQARLDLKNTILAQNTYLSGVLVTQNDCAGEIRSDGFNLIGYRGFGCTVLSGTGDQIGHHTAIDPLLNPLQTFGATSVHTLQSGSPAIDAGNMNGCFDYDDTLLVLDQLGVDRLQGFKCDIGASESGYFAGRVLVTPVSGSETTESGGSSRLTFQLNGIPAGSVTVPLTSSNPAEGTIADSVVFPSGINQDQIIYVYGVDDAIVDGDVDYQVITGAVTSADVRFDGFDPDDVSVTNLDDEVVATELIFIDSFE